MKLVESITRSANMALFSVKKHSPEILIATGIVGLVAGTVMACRATNKLEDILDDSKSKINAIHTVANDDELAPKYTEAEINKSLLTVYGQTAFKVAKLYAPAVGVGILSIGCILTSHRILKKRNFALAAAYTAVDRGFKEYRGKIIEKFGEKVDKEIRTNVVEKEVEETITDENGKEKKVKKTIKEYLQPSDYARFFDESNPNWFDDPAQSLNFLKMQEQNANRILRTRGYLLLNDVYNLLGFKPTKAGCVVGWTYNKNHPENSYVSFGLYDINNEATRAFINGNEKNILLDFNVHGYILDDIEKAVEKK